MNKNDWILAEGKEWSQSTSILVHCTVAGKLKTFERNITGTPELLLDN
jgi:hypothetical protein